MKASAQPLFPSAKLLTFLVGTALALTLASCYETSESHGFTGIAGDRIGDDYVYYPKYEVYYSPGTREYVYYNNGTWVRTTSPSQVWAADIAGAPSVRMDFHDSPEHHHAEIARAYPRTWTAPEAVPGVPARTTNDDVVEGRRDPDNKAHQ